MTIVPLGRWFHSFTRGWFFTQRQTWKEGQAQCSSFFSWDPSHRLMVLHVVYRPSTSVAWRTWRWNIVPWYWYGWYNMIYDVLWHWLMWIDTRGLRHDSWWYVLTWYHSCEISDILWHQYEYDMHCWVWRMTCSSFLLEWLELELFVFFFFGGGGGGREEYV